MSWRNKNFYEFYKFLRYRSALKFTFSFIIFLALFNCKDANSKVEIKIVDKVTGFTMKLPKGYERLNDSETSSMLSNGRKKVEEVNDVDIDISDLKPNIFKKDENNFFMVNIRNYDEDLEGDIKTVAKDSYEMLYKTYSQQFKNSEIDTLSSLETLDNVPFYKYAIKIKIPKKTLMNIESYKTILKGKDLSIVAVFIQNEDGLEIVKAIKTAKFAK